MEQEVKKEVVSANQTEQKNVIGLVGMIVAIVALVFSMVPVLGWILWFFGELFSVIGLFKKPRTCAVIGFILSLMGLVLTLLLGGIIKSLLF
ncbi:MAG: hypothetical protein K5860_12150 [Bacteroidales bacterium]|nr:hypothetical protein [Bacteroidales bacterium]